MMNMKKAKRGLVLVLAGALAACSTVRDRIPNHDSDLADTERRSFDLPAFTSIYVDANARLDISEGETQKVIVATEPGHFRHLVLKVENDELIIDHTEMHSEKYYTFIAIEVPQLEDLNIDAVTWTQLHDVDAEDFKMVFDGIGDVELKGSCVNGEFIIDGIGDFDGSEFKCQHVVADFDGIGAVHFFASETLALDASGIGDVQVDGNPRIKRSKIVGLGSTNIGNE